MMGENNIGSIFVEVQPGTNEALTRPFPLGAGRDKFGLGFQIASGDPKYARFRSCGSMSWAGMFNTEFWIDPVKHIGAVQMMQLLPFYDDGAIRTLRDFEELVYQNLRYEYVQSPTLSAQTSHACRVTMLRPRQIPVARQSQLPRHWGAIDQDIASGHDSEPTAAEGLKRSASDFRLDAPHVGKRFTCRKHG
jgi:hypothetical protein